MLFGGVPCGSDPVDLTEPPDGPFAGAEHEQVVGWRLKELLDAGYSVSVAERLAERTDIDLHRALELVKRGCRPEVAALILL